MGWKEYGKYGVCTGRTVRSPFAHSKRTGSWNPRLDTETLFKFKRGTENFSRYELDEFLCNNDIDDGLGDFNDSSLNLASESVHHCSICYSLKKRKRWNLAEKCSQQLSDLEDRWRYGRNITIIHRRVERKLKADCIAVDKTNRNEVLQSKRHLYARASDLLRNGDETDVQPELCYEISYRYPLSSYPVHAEVHRVRDDSSWKWPVAKARSKGKGAKKGARWGFYSDPQVRDKRFLSDEEPVEISLFQQRRHEQCFAKNKITIMNHASGLTFNERTRNVSDYVQLGHSQSIIEVETKVHDNKLVGTEQLPPLAREGKIFIPSADRNVETHQGMNSVYDFNLVTKRLSEVVSGVPERITLRRGVGWKDSITTSVECVDKFGLGNVNINKESIPTSLDAMASTPVVRISKTMAENVPSDKEVKCSRLPSPPKCPKHATRRCPRVRLRTQENEVLENGHKSSSVSSTEVERNLHSRVLTETLVAIKNTKKTHRSIPPLKHVSPSLLQTKCIENSLQNLEIVGTKVSVHYQSHCSLPCLSESRNHIVAIKNVRGSSMPRQVSLRHISTGQRRIKGACSHQCPENAEQPCINEYTIIGKTCAITPRHKALKQHKNAPCTKWISQEPRILSLRPSFLPVLHGRHCGVIVKKEEIQRAQKRSFVEPKELTSSSKHDKRVCLSLQCGKLTHCKTETSFSPENRAITTLLSNYQSGLPSHSSKGAIDSEDRRNTPSPLT